MAARLERDRAARLPLPAGVLNQGTGHGGLRPGRRARRGSEHGARSARLGPGHQPARQGDAVHSPVTDHHLGHPCLARRDRRRALRIPLEPNRPHFHARPQGPARARGQAARDARRSARRSGRSGHGLRPTRRHSPRAGELCRWWSPAIAAIASASSSTGSWASATCASRRSILGWARCPISTAPRCSRMAGRC